MKSILRKSLILSLSAVAIFALAPTSLMADKPDSPPGKPEVTPPESPPGNPTVTPPGQQVAEGVLIFDGPGDAADRNVNVWITKGTEGETTLIKDIEITAPIGDFGGENTIHNTVIIDNIQYFSATDDENGRELWKSDGTPEGTVMIKDINPGAKGSYPYRLTNVNGTLYFQADDGIHKRELWKSNGTEKGTVMIKDINPGPESSFKVTTFNGFENINGILYFSADDGINGRELWKSNGKEKDTVMVKNINPDGDSRPTWMVDMGGITYFAATENVNGRELWKSDGTPEGTVMVKNINPDSNSSSPSYLTNLNGILYFNAKTEASGNELWRSDGTADGTVMVKDIREGSDKSDPLYLTNMNGTLYFRAKDTDYGAELWRSNGTAEGTEMVKDINNEKYSSYPRALTIIDGTLYFKAYDESYPVGTSYGARGEIYRSDGTEAGTVPVTNNRFEQSGFQYVRINPTPYNGNIIFYVDAIDSETDKLNLFDWKVWAVDSTSVPSEAVMLVP